MRGLNDKGDYEIVALILIIIAVVAVVGACIAFYKPGPPMTIRYTCDDCGWNGTLSQCKCVAVPHYYIYFIHAGKVNIPETGIFYTYDYYCPICGSSHLTKHEYVTPTLNQTSSNQSLGEITYVH